MTNPEVKTEGRETRETHHNKGNRNKNKSDSVKRFTRPAAETFRGEHEDLKGYVYTYDEAARADQYDKTTKQIGQWVKKELQFSIDIYNSIKCLKEPDRDKWEPEELPEDATTGKRAIFNEKIKEFMLRSRTYDNNRTKVYTIVYGQCSDAMRCKLEAQDDWDEIEEEHNLVKLVKSIKAWMLNQQDSKSPVVRAVSSISAVFRIRQKRHEGLQEYRNRFTATVDVAKHTGVELGKALVTISNNVLKSDHKKEKRDDATSEEVKNAEATALDKLLAVAFLLGADKARFQEVITDLENQYLKGKDEYPKDVTSAYTRLLGWNKNVSKNETPFNDGLSFAQAAVVEAGPSDNAPNEKHGGRSKVRTNDRCYACGELVHHAWEKKNAMRTQHPENRRQPTPWRPPIMMTTQNHLMRETMHMVMLSVRRARQLRRGPKLATYINRMARSPMNQPVRSVNGELA